MGEGNKFGTFAGVFLPSVLAILGAVMYFIAPQVVGGVGLFKALIIILIAHSVTIATAFSISAIATNIKVKGGGLYYLISRSLGSEVGGALGIQLYLAQTIAASFYAIAFARGITSIIASFGIQFSEQSIALFSLLIFGIIVFIGARFVIKLQYVILTAIALSLVSIFLGDSSQTLSVALLGTETITFWVAFAMFFPAVTGIDAGVGMSGDLKNPRRSLVIGTFSSIFVTLAVYIAITFKYALSATPAELIANPNIVQQIALYSPLVIIGIILATSSSALSTLMTAPRCLIALIDDKILPREFNWLKKKVGNSDEPRLAILFTLAIGLFVISLGSLEFVSQIVAMFFLSVYGWINGAAFLEKISQNPSYRPTFSTPAFISFYGMFSAYAIMFLFNPGIMLISILAQFVVFYMLLKSKKSMKLESVWDGVFFQMLRMLLMRMDESEKSRKNWRPTILAFCANELNKDPIANILHWINEKRSLTKLYFLVDGDIKHDVNKGREVEKSLLKYTKDYKLEIFPKSILSNNFEATISDLMQAETLGNLPMNTVFLDFDRKIKINKLISDMVALRKNIIIMRNQSGFFGFKRIDVWWRSPDNGNFMLLLAYLITHSKQWLEQGASIRIMTLVENPEEKIEVQQKLTDTLSESRIENTELHIIEGNQDNIKEIMSKESEHADLVILGIPRFTDRESDEDIIENINEYTENMKVTLIVKASNDVDFKVN